MTILNLIKMTQEKQIDLLVQFHKDKMETLISKGKDYASKDDILSNFKNSGAIVGVSKERQILSLIATKVARLGNLLDNKDNPNNESIEDTVKDLSGYVDLMYCAFKENQKEFTGILSQLKDDEAKYKVGDKFSLAFNIFTIKEITYNKVRYGSEKESGGYSMRKNAFDSDINSGRILLYNN